MSVNQGLTVSFCINWCQYFVSLFKLSLILNISQVLFVADTRQTGTPAVTFTKGHGLDGPWGMVAGKNQ